MAVLSGAVALLVSSAVAGEVAFESSAGEEERGEMGEDRFVSLGQA